jgi:hypothetical protein
MNEQYLSLMREAVEGLKKILKISLPHCEDNNPLEDKFIEINKMSYETLQKFEKLVIQKIE